MFFLEKAGTPGQNTDHTHFPSCRHCTYLVQVIIECLQGEKKRGRKCGDGNRRYPEAHTRLNPGACAQKPIGFCLARPSSSLSASAVNHRHPSPYFQGTCPRVSSRNKGHSRHFTKGGHYFIWWSLFLRGDFSQDQKHRLREMLHPILPFRNGAPTVPCTRGHQ